MLTAVTGINWGDEGKGRVVDLLSDHADYVVRYQGGNNAGHTVVTDKGKFVLNLLPSGILHPEVVCVLGNGMVIDPDHLRHEIEMMRYMNVKISPRSAVPSAEPMPISMPPSPLAMINVISPLGYSPRFCRSSNTSTRPLKVAAPF